MPNTRQAVLMKTAHNYEIARDYSGKVNYEAYKNCRGFITENGLDFPIVVSSARYRYGHLDLLVSPENGAGTRWVQRTNVRLINDPAEVAF
jgi:hypothetical protein